MKIADILTSKINAIDYILKFTDLKKNGSEWRGKCPIHNGDNDTSFCVYPDNHYHCFACGATGDIINFVAEKDGISYREAMRQLANEFDIDLDNNPQFKSEQNMIDKNNRIIANTVGRVDEVRDYLHERGLTDETIDKFKLGASRGAVSIPIFDANGTAIAFAKRRFNVTPKYKNSPTSSLYEKGKVLFNLNNAKKIKSQYLYMVEGNFDAISGDQMGLPTVAYCGSIPTDEQIKLIGDTFREEKTIIFCPDNDETGQRIVKRARERFSHIPGFEVRVLSIPEGNKDFNDLLINKIDVSALDTTHIDKYVLMHEIQQLDTRERQYSFAVKYIRDVSNPLIKNDCIKWLAEYWNENLTELREIFKSHVKDIHEEVSDIHTVDDSINDLKDLYAHGSFKTGFTKIDDCIGGINLKTVVLCGAYASVGKSDFAVEWILRMSLPNKLRTLFFSMEMTRGKVMERFIAKQVGCTLRQVKDVMQENPEMVAQKGAELADYLTICDTDGLSLKDIEDKIMSVNKLNVMNGNVDVVIVDYLTKIKGTLDIGTFAEVCQRLKGIAKKYNIIIVMLAQFNRTGSQSEEPTMNQLRGSGDVEQGADYIFLMWRPAKNIKLSVQEQMDLYNITRLKVEKARDGMFGEPKCDFYYNPKTTRWEDR